MVSRAPNYNIIVGNCLVSFVRISTLTLKINNNIVTPKLTFFSNTWNHINQNGFHNCNKMYLGRQLINETYTYCPVFCMKYYMTNVVGVQGQFLKPAVNFESSWKRQPI